ncbi:aspartic-type endopeptidase-like protein [Thermochaetoides thermophila DSM 1495]|uniref:Aspartic-type endopeptidase-like protein n=1 Tax=Chaetomium thermophilum (strain DSM 1495 / CBS 144.50 / IMI 039719) TaxID=759272 RepID=G0RYV1_CHATD|nr:aspartic-type endopeptidase-like protein [Thermochaetoides thermophila DSM 1495]EGS23379.1 aspartic-type endopeptidase-like protein [Thermochaetoides thermophila DSM 1495]
MTRVAWIVLFGGLAGAKLHAEVLKHAPPGISYHVPKGILPTYSSKVVSVNHHVHQLRPVSTRHGFAMNLNSKSAASVLGIHQRHAGGFGYENITTTSAYGTQYAIEATWDGHPLSLLIDTGSSDTWAVSKDFHCIDYTGQFLPQSSCGFGEAYPDAFQYGRTDPPTHMFIQYGDGEIVTGPMGFSDITIGNITVKKQQVCLANTTYWFGNNYTSGLLGLAFPSLTNAYYGDSGTDHDYGSQVQYSPLFTSMVSQGLVDPLFSIAIDRNASSGMISFGGIAPAVGADFSRSATLDMIITNIIGVPATAFQYSFYTVIPDGWYFDSTMNTKKYPYIVDSGTTLNYLPPSLADAINAAFTPPAVYMWMYGAYFTSCDAIAPQVAVVLDGEKFYINPVDLIYRTMVDPLTGLCMTAIASGGSGPYILGDVFMQNALVVFDVGEAKMRFIPRPHY